MTNSERRMQHKRLQGLCTKNSLRYSQTEGRDMLKRCDFRCVLEVENVRDRCRSTGRLFQARGPATARARSPMVECHIAATELQPWMQNVVDDTSLCLTAAGSTRTDTVVLLCLDSGALECKVYTGCVQRHAASAASRSVVSHGRTGAHQP